jgi:hypothetical protein
MAVEAAAISIIDRLISLLTVRERNREKYFKNFIDPLYRDAELVARDYMGLFAELLQRLESATTFEEIIAWLEQRRASYRPVRMKIRALLADKSLNELGKSKRPTYRTRFAKGIWGILKANFSLAQNAAEGKHVYLREYGYSDHPILLFLQSMQSVDPAISIDEKREFLLSRAHKQQLVL